MLIYGPATVISQRTGMEAVFAGAGGSTYLDSLGLCDRWTNYTAHPSQTPGRDSRDDLVTMMTLSVFGADYRPQRTSALQLHACESFGPYESSRAQLPSSVGL